MTVDRTRNEQMRRWVADGYTVDQVAARFEVHPCRVRRALAAWQGNKRGPVLGATSCPSCGAMKCYQRPELAAELAAK